MKIEHPGLIVMPAADYHADPALGHSALIKILRSPAHYLEYRNAKHEPTPAMEFGTALHAAILEPESFSAEYAVFDETLLTGTLQSAEDYKAAAEKCGIKVGKMKKEEIKEAIKASAMASEFKFRDDVSAEIYANKIVLKVEDMAAIKAIQINVSKHFGAASRLVHGYAEMSVFWQDPATGVQCKCRPDFLVLNAENKVVAIVDVKSTRDASNGGFSKAIANYGYDVQAAYYTDGLKQAIGYEVPFFFLAIESDAPYAVALYQADAEMLEVGRKKAAAGMMLLQWCQQTGEWPSYQPTGEVEAISLPKWAVNGARAFDIE